jgi:hypothetical protein
VLLILIGIAAKDSGWNHAKKVFLSRSSGGNVEDWAQKKEALGPPFRCFGRERPILTSNRLG